MTPPAAKTLEEAIIAALAAGDEQTAAVMLRRAFGRGPAPEPGDLPELIEELAEYFASVGRAEDAVAMAVKALQRTSAEADLLRRRCRLAEMVLKIGLPDEACALYAAVAGDAPGQTWVHEAAGSDYVDAGDHELAFAWLTAGLEQAIAQDEGGRCVARLLGLRRISMDGLGLAIDDLDRRASALIDPPHTHPAQADDLLLVVELDGDGVAPQRALGLLERLRQSGADLRFNEPAQGSAS